MSDRSWGQIIIGGRIASVLVETLREHAQEAGCEYEDEPAAVFIDGGDLAASLDEDGHLVLTDANAIGGQFDELETFLVENGIPYDRYSQAYTGSYDGQIVAYRPDWNGGAVKAYHADADGDERRIDPDEIREIFANGEISDSGKLACIAHLVEEPPALPRVEIYEPEAFAI